MVLRIDDTDVDRNTDASRNSIFEGLKWLDLGWDELYHQSERLDLHRQVAWKIFEKGLAYRDFTPASADLDSKEHSGGPWLFDEKMRGLSAEESQRRADAGEPFVLRFRVPRTDNEFHQLFPQRRFPVNAPREVEFEDAVFGRLLKSVDDIEDFALLRSNGIPTYHMASCADDLDLKISHIIRGQDHLTNTFKHVLIFEAAGAALPTFAHLPLLIAPDGSKLSKRKHGPVVSVTTYRDEGFLPHAFINFLCLLGWSPKDNREQMTRQELTDAFSFEGINHSNAVVNFTEQDPFDPKAVWLNAELIRTMPVEELAKQLLPFVPNAALPKMLQVAPLVQERIKLLKDVASIADFFFLDELPPYDSAELIPQKGDAQMALTVLARASEVLATTEFTHDALDQTLRSAAQQLKVKPGQMFQPIRVAVCGRKNAPPLFETLEVLGRATTLRRLSVAHALLRAAFTLV